jgi:hypothetical protein
MPIDEVEIQAFFGVLLIIRVLKARREPLKMLWPTNPSFRRPIISAAMSRDRFIELWVFIRFCDADTTEHERK